MNQSRWLILVFVATMVCNGNCRPREVDVKNLYPVYRSDKQLELETPNRYEKPFKSKPDNDSVAYLRIDIPHKNDLKFPKIGKNISESVIDYVPVSLTVKKTNVKKWPSDQNGIESPDDLSLYNIYTNNINPLNLVHATTAGYNLAFPYVTHSKPSILILEELTTPKPFYPDTVFTRPIQVHNRPVAPPLMYDDVPQPLFPVFTQQSPHVPSESVDTTKKPLFYPHQPDYDDQHHPEHQNPNYGSLHQTHVAPSYQNQQVPSKPLLGNPNPPVFTQQKPHVTSFDSNKPVATTKKPLFLPHLPDYDDQHHPEHQNPSSHQTHVVPLYQNHQEPSKPLAIYPNPPVFTQQKPHVTSFDSNKPVATTKKPLFYPQQSVYNDQHHSESVGASYGPTNQTPVTPPYQTHQEPPKPLPEYPNPPVFTQQNPHQPVFDDQHYPNTQNYGQTPVEPPYQTHPANPFPSYPPHIVTPTIEQSIHNFGYVSSTLQPETTTKKRKSTKCPNVSIIATSSINNNNGMNKEGCQDISIHIDTNLSNTNTKPAEPVNSSGVTVQNDQTIGIFGIFEVFWSIISRFFDFSGPIITSVLSPFSALLAGGVNLSTLVLPWFFPHLTSRRKKRPKRGFVILGKSGLKSVKYLYRSIDDNSSYLKRTRRDVGKLQTAYAAWDKGKKISRYSSDDAKTEAETVEAQNVNKPKEPKFNIESIATVARASHDGPSLQPSAAIGQLIDNVGQMVDSDIRTPPKLKEIIKEKSNENRRDALGEGSTPLPYTFVYEEESKVDEDPDKSLLTDSSEGKASHMVMKMATDEGVKGIAIPVMMDDTDLEPTAPPKKLQKIPEVPKPAKEDKKKNGVNKIHPTTTPSSGLSTWILLSDNKDVTTPSPKKNNKKEGNEDKKKTTGAAPTTKKPIKIQATTLKTSTAQSNKKVTSKPTSGGKKPENDAGSMSALEAMVKNQKKNVATTLRPKTSEDSKSGSQKKPTDPKKKITDRLEVAETKDKFEIELPSSRPTYTLPTNLPITTEEKSVTTTTDQTNAQSTTESSVEGTTKKKSSSKKKKKNKNRRRKPTTDTGVEAKIPQPAVGSQIYNFISREIVPTVGLGLIGVALTAGLASFLGYNPFASTAVPLRRTYESHHGYTPNNYYNYNTEYGDGGQSEEVLFREVLSGMPEDSRYGMTHTDTNYPEAYNRQDQVYDGMKNPVYSSATGNVYNSDKDVQTYDSNYPQDYSSAYGTTYDTQDKKYGTDVKEKYPMYSRETGTSFVYPETTGMTSPDKSSRVSDDYETQNNPADTYKKTGSDTIERQPEALYRVAGETELQYKNGESTIQGVSNQNSWHKIGSPMDAKKAFPHLEPGPRSLDLSKMEEKKRVKRDADSVIQKISRKRTKKQNDVENEIDLDDSVTEKQILSEDLSTTTSATKTTTSYAEVTTTSPDMDKSTFSTTEVGDSMSTTTEDSKEASSVEPTDSYEEDHNDTTAPGSSAVSVLDVLKRLAQFKLRLGLNFLRSTTDLFSRYLDDIQRRVDESFTNTTTTTVQYNRRKNPWSRIFFSTLSDSFRRRRSVLNDNQLLSAMFTEDNKMNERFSKSTKKDLRLSNKIFHQKKNSPKKYESNRIN